MKLFFVFLHFFLLFKSSLYAQKPPLDTASFKSWPTISNELISDNGRIIVYTVSSSNDEKLLCIRSDEGYKIRDFRNASNAIITEDNHKIIFQLPGDSLCIYSIDSNSTTYFNDVVNVHVPKIGNSQWIAWEKRERQNDLVLCNYCSNTKKIFENVDKFDFSNNGEILIVESYVQSSLKKNQLVWFDIKKGVSKILWEGADIKEWAFNDADDALAFLVSSGDGEPLLNAIWYYSIKLNYAEKWIDPVTEEVQMGLTVADREIYFSPGGNRLYFKLCRLPSRESYVNYQNNPRIWSYEDEVIRSIADNDEKRQQSRCFLAVCKVGEKNIVRLEQKSDGGFRNVIVAKGGSGDFALSTSNVNIYEGYLKRSERPDINLIRIKDGSRICIKKEVSFGLPFFSPNGRYVIWYDYNKKNYFVYDIEKSNIRNITNSIHTNLSFEPWDKMEPSPPYGQAGWFAHDSVVLIYDRYDIWQVDPLGIIAPINLTNGYGRRNKISFRVIDQAENGNLFYELPVIKSRGRLLMCAFNERTKQNGFYEKKVDNTGNPIKLTMTNDFYYFPSSYSYIQYPTFLKKAKMKNIFLIKKMNVRDFPNLQITSNFRIFTPISDLNPQNKYNWISSELFKWKVNRYSTSQGLLYKPEDFDSSKKYPLIVYIYDRFSDGLNTFIDPEPCEGPINISWFVSHDYLVFCPDIVYKIGDPSQSVIDYVTSAVRKLKMKSWVESTKIGLQGHSFGGYEVNCLITNTNLFAAAVSAAGFSDLISMMGSDIPDLWEPHYPLEQGYLRMGISFWRGKNRYIKDSPIFRANNAFTPLLLMHNKGDRNVPWNQGFEFFTALRRLNKKVWMIQYESGSHSVGGRDALDYTNKMTSFFDYYLKMKPKPEWMTNHVQLQ
jgi:dipeptidyl aminopeptidase/acylaminoacyl peptidase